MSRSRRLLLALLTVAGLLGNVSPARADELLDFARELAVELTQFLKHRKEASVSLDFRGPATLKGSGGVALTEIVTKELKGRGIAVAARANFGFKGEFKPVREDDLVFAKGSEPKKQKFIRLQIKGNIVDAFGDSALRSDFTRVIKNERTLLQLLGLDVDLNGVRSPGERTKRIADALGSSQGHADGNQASPSKTSPFAVEILVANRPRPLTGKDGLLFTNLELGEEYTVRLINRAPHEVAVAVAVDGLSFFHFSELRATEGPRKGEPLYRYRVIPPGKTAEVKGWFKTHTRTTAFRITPFGESAAAKLGKTTDIGMITATFHASWEDGDKPPSDEPVVTKVTTVTRPETRYVIEERVVNGRKVRVKLPVTSMATETKIGTGFGSEITTSSSGVKRTIGQVRGNITIRYARKAEK